MALTKTVVTMISNQTVTASGKIVSIGSIDLSEAIDLEITATMKFNSTTNGGARVELFSDPSGANTAFSIGSYDEPIDSFDISSKPGYTKSKTEQMKKCSKYAKVRVVNLGNQSITGVYVRAIIQKQ